MIGARAWHKLHIRIEHLWISIPFFVVIGKGLTFTIPLFDFWWHLKMGEVIVTTGSIPRTDIFSFTAAGEPFLVQNWLAEIAYYLLYRVGGMELLVLFNALLLAAALVPIFTLCRQSAESLRLGAFITTLIALTFFGSARPHTFSFALFAVFYWILEEYRQAKGNLVWTLPLLMALWVNLHGAFVLGLALIVLYIACEACSRQLSLPGSEWLSGRKLGSLLLVLALCLAATLANPHLYQVYEYVWTIAADKASQSYVTEWQAPRVDTFEGMFLFYGLFFICLLSFFYSRRKLGLTDLVLFMAFSIFAMTALRNTIWFSMIAAPILSRHLKSVPFAELLNQRSRTLIYKLRTLPVFKTRVSAPRYLLNFVIAAALGVTLVLFSPWFGPSLRKTSILDPKTPVGAMNFIEQNGIAGRIFHPQIFGDYLIWRLWPKHKSFIDGRVHLFGEPFVLEYLGLFADSGWEENLERHNIQFLLLSKDKGNSSQILTRARKSKNWRLLYEDSISALFERVSDFKKSNYAEPEIIRS